MRFKVGIVLAVLVMVLGLGWWRSRAPLVAVAHPKLQTIVQAVAASGTVAGVDESDVGAELGGRVAGLFVKEGDRVKKGQRLAQLETGLLEAQRTQAQAALNTAQAQLAQAQRGPLPSEVARVEAEVQQSEGVAQAQVNQAGQRLAELRHGPTREELEQVKGQAQQALAQRNQNRRESARLQKLLQSGFVTQQDYEQALTRQRVSEQVYLTSYNRLRESQVGTRPEVLSQARAALSQAQANLEGARQTGVARLQNLRDQPRPEDVQVAQARLKEARINFKVAEERLRQADIRAPYAGTVTRLFLKAGQLTGANAPILHMVRGTVYEIQVNVDELNLGRLKQGLEAVVSSDAYPETFSAHVREIAPQVVSERGTVLVKLDPEKPPGWLKPGMTVSVNIVFEKGKSRPVVPITSVTVAGRRSTVLILKNGLLEEREVELGSPNQDGFPVYSGVEESDWVVQNRTGLLPGQKARGN